MKRMKKRLLTILMAVSLLTAEILPAFTVLAAPGEGTVVSTETSDSEISEDTSFEEGDEEITGLETGEEAKDAENNEDESALEESGNEDESSSDEPANEDESASEEESENEEDSESVSDEEGYFSTIEASIKDDVEINESTFPDDGFRNYVKENYDVNKDGKLNAGEIRAVTKMKIFNEDYTIQSLEGIQYFTDLYDLEVDVKGLKELNVSGMVNLKYLYCGDTDLTVLNVSGLVNLEFLSCVSNQLTTLDVRGLVNLKHLFCEENQLTSLNVSGLVNLEELNCDDNQLTTLDVSGLENLTSLECNNNQLTELRMNNCPSINVLYCAYNQLTSLDDNVIKQVSKLSCSNNPLTTLDLSNNTALSYLSCSNAQLTGLNVSGLVNLKYLYCNDNQLTALNLNNFTSLESLNCSGNQITSLQLIGCTNLWNLSCKNNRLVTLNVGGLTKLENLYCENNQISMLQVSGCTGLKTLTCDNNNLTGFPATGLDSLKELACHSNKIAALDLTLYPKLDYLNCRDNQLTDLDLSSSSVTSLICDRNQLTRLKLNNRMNILSCSGNQLTELDLSICKNKISSVVCIGNKLTTLDIKDAIYLWKADCSGNELTDLDVSNCTNLNELICDNNKLTTLDVSTCTELIILSCSNNYLTSLDLGNCEKFESLLCNNNRYQVEMKSQRFNGDIMYYFDLSDLPKKGFDRSKSAKWFDETNQTLLGRKPTSDNKLFVDSETKAVTYQYDCGGGHSASFTLCKDAVTFTPETGVAIDEVNFPDGTFRYLINHWNYDLNDDGLLSDDEIEKVTEMDFHHYTVMDLTGIEHFTSLVTLKVDGTYEELNFDNLPSLKNLEFWQYRNNIVGTLKISNCNSLETIKCSNLSLQSLQVVRCPKLNYLECENNPLVSVKLLALNENLEAKGLKSTSDSPCRIPATKIETDAGNRFDLSTLPGFEIGKTSAWNGGTVSGNTLTLTEGSGEVRFLYDCGMDIKVEMTLQIKGIEGLWISSVADQLFTGSAIKPEVEVYCGDKKLTAGKDYSISYRNNTNAAAWDALDGKGKSIAPTIVVTGKGNYTGTATKTFTITPVNLTKRKMDAQLRSLLTIEPVYVNYNGKVIKGKPVIKFRGKTLPSKYYTLEYNDATEGAYKEEGIYSITIKGKGPNVTGSCTVNEYISKNIINKVSVKLEKTSVPYDVETGITHPGVITVMNGKEKLSAGIHYFVSYLNDDKSGTATVVITGNNDAGWYGVKTVNYKIIGTKLTKEMIEQKTTSFNYNKHRHFISDEDYRITYNDETLVKDKDYIISYTSPEKNYTNPGSFKVTFTGIGRFTGSVTKTWTIQKTSLTTLWAEDDLGISYKNSDYTKGGTKARIEVSIWDEKEFEYVYLKEGVDYTVTYKNNGKVASKYDKDAPYFYITGKGGYTGNTKAELCYFNIWEADIEECATIMAEDILYKNKIGNSVTPVSVIDNKTGKKLSKGTDYEPNIKYEYFVDGKWVEINPKTEKVDASERRVKIRVTITGCGNYEGTITDTYEVYPKNINTSSVVIDPIPNQTYSGTVITPKPTVKLKVKSGNTYTYTPLTEGVDYSLKYSKNVQQGTATVYIYGEGEYGGVKKVSFKIVGKKLEWWKKLL